MTNLFHFKPYYEDRMLVRRLPFPAESEIIVRPENVDRTKDVPQYGEVVSVADGNTFKDGVRVPTTCKPGDRIVYQRRPAHQFEHDGETYTFMFEEQDVLLVLE